MQNKATALAKKSLEEQDDVLLSALVFKVKQSVLDTLDIDYKRMASAGLPKSAAAALTRQHDNPRVEPALLRLSLHHGHKRESRPHAAAGS